MGKTYKATITVSCLKEHTCVACQSKFAYPLMREVTGEAANEEQALVNAQNAANKAAEGEVDMHACPNCGVIQPEMIANVRSNRYWFGIVATFVGVLLALILGLTDVITISTSAYIAAGTMAIVLAWCVIGTLYNPNKDLESNRMGTAAELTEKSAERWNDGPTEVGGLTAGHYVGLMLLVGTVLIALAPVMLAAINGWAHNSTTYPSVCGPGDKPCIYFNDKITSVKGYWTGSVSAQITNAAELGLQNVPISGETKNSHWGDTISGKSVNNNTNRMWAKINLPSNAELAGKTIKLSIKVGARFPFKVGNGFNDDSREFSHQTEVTLSSPNSGAKFKTSWWLGQVSVLVLSMVGCGILLGTCRSLKKQANPTRIAPLEVTNDEE